MERQRAHLLGIIVLATVILGWGIWRVPPHQLNGDEWSAVGQAILMLFHEPVTQSFRKGGNFHVRLLGLAFLPLAAYWYATGRFWTMNEGTTTYTSNVPLEPSPVLDGFYQAVFVGRMVSVLAAVGTVYLTYLLTREVASHRAGIVASIALIAAPGFVTISKFANEDAPQFFLVVLTLYLLVVAVKRENNRELMLAAVALGLAVSMKATSGLLIVPMGLAIYEMEWRPSRSFRHLLESSGLYAALAAIGYFATTPSALLYPRYWVLSIVSYIGFSVTNAPVSAGTTYQDPAIIVAGTNYARSMGGLLAIASLVALTILVVGLVKRRYDRRIVLVLAFAIPYALLLFTPKMPQYPRTMLLHPMAALGVGVVVADLFAIEVDTALRKIARGLPIALVTATLVITLVSTGVLIADFGTSRAEATDWLETHTEPGDEIDAYGYRLYAPEAPASTTVYRPFLDDPTDDTGRLQAARRVARRCPRYVILSSSYYGRFFNHPEAFPQSTAFIDWLLSGESSYDTAARFGPPPLRDYTNKANLIRSFDYPPAALSGDANPTIVILERSSPPAAAC